MQTAPTAPRPRLDLAHLLHATGQPNEALAILEEAVAASPAALPLIAGPLADAAIATHQTDRILDLLKTSYAHVPSMDVLGGIVTLEAASQGPSATARDWYVRHLERAPSLVAAAKWIAGEKLEHEQFHPQVQRALDHAVKPLTRYRCAACGFEAKQHFWQCPGCQAWDSYPARRVEEL